MKDNPAYADVYYIILAIVIRNTFKQWQDIIMIYEVQQS